MKPKKDHGGVVYFIDRNNPGVVFFGPTGSLEARALRSGGDMVAVEESEVPRLCDLAEMIFADGMGWDLEEVDSSGIVLN